MAWTSPTTRSTGDLITAAIWNIDLVDDLTFLHTRVVTALIPPKSNGGAGSSDTILGDFRVVAFANTSAANVAASVFNFHVPADFAALTSAHIIAIASATTTLEYNLTTDYGAAGEVYNNHSGSSTDQTLAMTINVLTEISIAGVLASLAAGDYVGVTFAASAGANAANWNIVGLRLRYTRT